MTPSAEKSASPAMCRRGREPDAVAGCRSCRSNVAVRDGRFVEHASLDHERCVTSGRWASKPCGRRSIVERDGVPWCHRHDPAYAARGPTEDDTVLHVGELTREIASLRAEVATIAALRAEIAALVARLPPPGWSPGNYVRDDDPAFSLVVDTHARRWSVWHSGRPGEPARGRISEGATPAEAVARSTS